MRTAFGLVAASLILCSREAVGQSLFIGAVEVRLGEDGDTLLNRFSGERIERIESFGGAAHVVFDGHGTELGQFITEHGRVTSISRNWASAPDTRVATTSDVIKALSQLKGQTGCTIHPAFAEVNEPRQDARGIVVDCHGHRISIKLMTVEGYAPSPDVSEEMGR